jgi:hypothetical protein
MPLTTGQGQSGAIGLSGERILAKDLHLPPNDSPDQLQCFCNSATHASAPPPKGCRVCLVSVQLTGPYRRPDFVARAFIAESKNAQNLYYENRDLQEITDYATAARAMNMPLWVFTRVNTNIDSEFTRVVNTTGGGVVPYFTVPGWVDPVNQAARIGLISSALVIAVFSLFGMFLRRGLHIRPVAAYHRPKNPKDPLGRAVDSVDNLGNFTKKSKDTIKDKLDES